MNAERAPSDRRPDDCSITCRLAVAVGLYGALSALLTVRIALDPYLSGLGILALLKRFWGLWLVLGFVWAVFTLMATGLLLHFARRKEP